MKETGVVPSTPKSGENKRKPPSPAGPMEEEPPNFILEGYKTNAKLMEATLRQLRRRNNALVRASLDVMSELESLHKTSVCVERYLAPTLEEKIREHEILQAKMDEITRELEKEEEDEQDGSVVQKPIHTNATHEAPVDNGREENSVSTDTVNTIATEVGAEILKEVTSLTELLNTTVKNENEENKTPKRKKIPIAEQLENMYEIVEHLKKQPITESDEEMETLLLMEKCDQTQSIQQRQKNEQQDETVESKDKENQREHCELKHEMYALFNFVHTTKLKETNEGFNKRVKQLELDLIGDMDTGRIVDGKIKRLGEIIAMLTAEYTIMESRAKHLPELEETCKVYSDVLACRQGLLADKGDKITELRKILSERMQLNLQKLKQQDKRSLYVKAAHVTLTECARLIETAIQGINCAHIWEGTTFCTDSKALSQIKLSKSCESSKTSVQTERRNVCENSKTSVQTQLTTSCENSTLLQTLLANPCEDSKDLVQIVLMKLRLLLPVIGDPVKSLSYLLRNATSGSTEDLMSFSILDVQMYHPYSDVPFGLGKIEHFRVTTASTRVSHSNQNVRAYYWTKSGGSTFEKSYRTLVNVHGP